MLLEVVFMMFLALIIIMMNDSIDGNVNSLYKPKEAGARCSRFFMPIQTY